MQSKSSMKKFIENSVYGDPPAANIINDEHSYVQKLLMCHTNLQQYILDINHFGIDRLSNEKNASIFCALRESARLFSCGEFKNSLDCIENAQKQNPDSSLLDIRKKFILTHAKF